MQLNAWLNDAYYFFLYKIRDNLSHLNEPKCITSNRRESEFD